MVNKWEKIKGELPCKWTQRKVRTVNQKNGVWALCAPVTLDLFLCKHENYGYILALRTGSHDWNQKRLLPALKGNGYRLENGFVYYAGGMISVPEEIDLLRRAGFGFVEPQKREV